MAFAPSQFTETFEPDFSYLGQEQNLPLNLVCSEDLHGYHLRGTQTMGKEETIWCLFYSLKYLLATST
jgi:hypothetical protein